MGNPEITTRIATDDLERLVEVSAQSARVTAEMPAVDLDQILRAERGASNDVYLPVAMGEAFDAGALVLLEEAYALGSAYIPASIASPIAPETLGEPLVACPPSPASLGEISVDAMIDLGELVREELSFLDVPTENNKRMRIVFEPTVDAFAS